jgi:hypothetical protein
MRTRIKIAFVEAGSHRLSVSSIGVKQAGVASERRPKCMACVLPHEWIFLSDNCSFEQPALGPRRDSQGGRRRQPVSQELTDRQLVERIELFVVVRCQNKKSSDVTLRDADKPLTPATPRGGGRARCYACDALAPRGCQPVQPCRRPANRKLFCDKCECRAQRRQACSPTHPTSQPSTMPFSVLASLSLFLVLSLVRFANHARTCVMGLG